MIPHHIAHVPIPLSVSGSSVTTVVRFLCEEHAAAGGHSSVVLADNRDTVVAGARNVFVDFTENCPREWFTRAELLHDHVLGRLGRARKHAGAMFVPAARAINGLRPDLVLLHEGHYATSSLPYWRRIAPGVPVVLYLHTRLSRSYGRRELRRLLAICDAIVGVSQFSLDALNRRVGRLDVPHFVVHNGVDQRVFHPTGRQRQEGALRVTFAGEIAQHKGVHILFDALASLTAPATVNVVGSSKHAHGAATTPYERLIRDRAVEAGLAANFIPYQEQSALAEVFRESDVVCVPSIGEESFGMVALEAMACGAAVVASSTGGLPEACRDAAILVPPGDAQALRGALESLQEAVALQEMQRRALARAASASWAASYEALASGLTRVL